MHAIDDMLVVQALLKADQTGLDKSVIQQQASPRVVGFWGSTISHWNMSGASSFPVLSV